MEEKVEVKTIVLDNGRNYFLIDELLIDNIKYYYLANVDDTNDICVRKEEIENGISFLSTLKDMDELMVALKAFKAKQER